MSWYAEALSRLIGVTVRGKVLRTVVGGIILVTALVSPATIAEAIKYRAERTAATINNTVVNPIMDEWRKQMIAIAHPRTKQN